MFYAKGQSSDVAPGGVRCRPAIRGAPGTASQGSRRAQPPTAAPRAGTAHRLVRRPVARSDSGASAPLHAAISGTRELGAPLSASVHSRPMNDLAGKHIVLGLTGGIACYKSAELCRGF